MTPQLVRLGAHVTTSGIGETSDPNYLNAGGWVVAKDGIILSMRRILPASASVTYVSPQNSGYSIIAFDATDPTNVFRATPPYEQVYGLQPSYPGEARGVLLLDDILYSGHAGALVILDVSNPLSIVELGRFVDSVVDNNQPRMTTPQFVDGAGILWGGHACLNTFFVPGDGIFGFDVSNPAAIAASPGYFGNVNQTFGQSGQGSTTSWDDRWLAAVDYQSFAVYGVRIWDTQNPTDPPVYATWTGMSSSDWPRAVQHVRVGSGDYLFIVRRNGGNTAIIDVTNPLVPVEVTASWSLHSYGGDNSDIHPTVVEWAPWLVVMTYSNSNQGRLITLIDFSNPAVPVKLHEITTSSGGPLTTSNISWQGAYAEDDLIYVGDFNGRAAVFQVTEVVPPSSVIGTWAWKGLA